MIEMAGYSEINEILRDAEQALGAAAQLTEGQLVGLQVRWSRALSARLDAVLEVESDDDRRFLAVATAWHELASHYEVLRSLIDAHEATSLALAESVRTEARMLALAAGIRRLDDPIDEAVGIGLAYRRLIRSSGAEHAGVSDMCWDGLRLRDVESAGRRRGGARQLGQSAATA